MLTRREFLSGTTVLVLIPLAKGCYSGTNYPPADGGGGTGCDGPNPSSSYTDHAHRVCVPNADLANPPAGGKMYTTTSVSGHAHTVTLSQADLQSVNAGGTVDVTTSESSGHTHTFMIKKS